jgi:uncharacterized protein (TIGR02217 family)
MPSNFIDHRIATRVSSEFRRVVTGKTDIVPMANGRERRNAAWAFKKMQFSASFAMLTPESQEEVVSAFYAANAQLLLFRFKDHGDYTVTNSPIVGGVVGQSNAVQLTKQYTFGSASAYRVIQAVNKCTVKTPGGVDFPGTFSTTMGTFDPSGNWASGIYTWSGTFDCWVRFNSDDFDVTMRTLDIATTDVSLIEQVAYAS